MPVYCSTCKHARRAEIDAALLGGEPRRRVAVRFQLPEANVRRHATHLSEAVQNTLDVRAVLAGINAAAMDVLQRARQRNDGRTTLAACSVVLRQLEFAWAIQSEAQASALLGRVEALERLLVEQHRGAISNAAPNGWTHEVYTPAP